MRRTRRILLGLTACGLAALAGCAGDDTGGAIDSAGTAPLRPGVTTTVARDAGTVLVAQLVPGEEVPGPGATGGKGTASLTLHADGQVCGTITVSGLENPTAAHIHTGAAGIAGPVLVPLKAPTGGKSDGCVPATAEQVAQILANPAGYYVNVHTKELPNGAIRGQLAKA